MVSIAQLCSKINARYFSNGREASAPLSAVVGFAELEEASTQHIAFINDPKHLKSLQVTRAGVVILPEQLLSECPVDALVVEDVYLAFAEAIGLFSHRRSVLGRSIHAKSCVADDVKLPQHIRIDAGAVIEEGCVIGEGTVIRANAVIERGVVIGKNCYIDVHASIMHHCVVGDGCVIGPGSVIGAEGFGNAWDKKRGQWHSIYHQGRVVLQDQVEIGANSTIDRGTISDTVIAHGVRIDNLVMVAHNCYIGEHSALAGQVGMAGHTQIGKRVKVAGQVGLIGHISVADESTLMGKALIAGSIKEKGVYAGYPCQPFASWRKEVAMIRRQLKQLNKNKT